jgi:hypothetical protein
VFGVVSGKKVLSLIPLQLPCVHERSIVQTDFAIVIWKDGRIVVGHVRNEVMKSLTALG